jgi:hypothetical protein
MGIVVTFIALSRAKSNRIIAVKNKEAARLASGLLAGDVAEDD